MDGQTATLTADQTSYTFEDLPQYKYEGGEASEIAYSVDEVEVTGYSTEVGEVSGDAEEGYSVTITNTQDTTTLTVDKEWVRADGSDTWPDGVEVEVQLTADGEAVEGQTATLTADQTSYTFENLPQYKYEGGEASEIEYSVEEVLVPAYSTEIGDVSGSAEDGYEVTITNTEKTITTQIQVAKKLSGRGWQNGDSFTFTLKAKNGAPMPNGSSNGSKSVTVTNSNPASFGAIVYTVGEFEYTITENKGSLGGITYDSKEHKVTVTVELDDNNELVSSVSYDGDDSLIITNPYAATGSFQITAHKTFSGKTLEDGQFSFQLCDENGNVIETAKNDASGNIAFSPFFVDSTIFASGSKSATLKFTVKEQIPETKEKNVTYDTKTYTATVTLTDNGKGQITASIAWTVNGASASGANFVNYYSTAVATGDTRNPAPFGTIALLALLGLGGTIAVLATRKKKKR